MNKPDTPAKVASNAQLGGWALPPGWLLEQPDYMPNCVVIGNIGLGWVTVDIKERIFGAGLGKPRKWGNSDSGHTFSGGNWRKRIMDAAEEYLRACNSDA